jgi:hypothetical protein
MTALSGNISREVQPLSLEGMLALASAAAPFLGSGLTIDSSGNVASLAAGSPFVGFCSQQIESRFAPTAGGGPSVAGGASVRTDRGIFLVEVPITVVVQDVYDRRAVFMSDDATFTFTPTGNTYIGNVVGLVSGAKAIVCCFSAGFKPMQSEGVFSIAATGNQTLDMAHIGKMILCPNTAALTLTLPAAARWAGRRVRFKKTTAAAFAVTLAGNGAETIDGANTNAALLPATQWKGCELESDGTQILIVASV